MPEVESRHFQLNRGQFPCIPSGGTANAFVTRTTNALSQFTTAKYYPCSSLTASTVDLNSLTTSFTYDGLDRLTQQTLPDGSQATNCYSDITGASCYSATVPPYVITTTKTTSALNLIFTTQVDGLGRAVQTQLNSDPQGTTYTDMTYDALGRQGTVSNAYRTSNDPGPTNGISTTSYDALGRVTRVTPPDGNPTTGANTVNTAYSGSCATMTDQAGKIRKSCSDGLGRLTQVFEPDASNNLVNETDYTYDALDNLLTVNQKGNDLNSADWRTRTFVYNSLSQLTSATNPETGPIAAAGTITYSYNNDGILTSKTDGRGITINYSPAASPIDALHRVTEKTYSDSTPTVRYAYDGVAPSGCTLPTLTIHNGVGKRTGMCDGAGAEAWSWDITSGVGWKVTDARTTNGVTKSTIYQHNFDGSLFSLTYPSGRVMTYALAYSGTNTAARPASAVDSTGPINYATGALYAPQGALSYVQNGVGFYSTFLFNDRLQPCWVYATTSSTGAPTTCAQTGVSNAAIMDFQYGFNLGTANNGNVSRIANRIYPSRSITYLYDELNRIHDAVTDATSGQFCWGQLFGTQSGSNFTSGYDAWGNLKTITPDPSRPGCSVGTMARTINVYNKIVDSNYGYDNAGNLTADPSLTYSYNAENQLTATAGMTYLYDGDGKRVEKATTGPPLTPTKLYWYGAGSDALDETDAAGNTNNSPFNEYVFFGSKRIARRDSSNNVFYYFSDHLGTSREIVQAGQTTLCYDADYYPFGVEAVVATNTCSQNYKFTGKERDSESGLDNFLERYYTSQMGRFMSPDPAGMFAVRLAYPQTLNRYSYVLNNPLSLADPLGLDCAYLNDAGNGIESVDQNSSAGECGGTGGYWVTGTLTQANIDPNETTISLQGTTNGTDVTSASYQQYTTLDVGWYQNTLFNPFGHIALGACRREVRDEVQGIGFIDKHGGIVGVMAW
ncbi:MAG: RHS repeat-associated core domain-containing protein [Candidatus Acidiferrum sp.]